MKRKIKVWGRMKIYEASVVGIPAYPDAHASTESFSLIKALSMSQSGFVDEADDISDQLNEEKNETMENIDQPNSNTEKSEKLETEKKTDMSEIAKAIAEGIKEGMKELQIERGLVDKQIPVKKSLGEMAIDKGLFVKF